MDWDIEIFREPLGDWYEKFYGFLISGQMDKIFDQLQIQGKKGIQISPDPSNVFKAFKKCPLKELKCVFLGLAPYASFIGDMPISDGLAFSCSIPRSEQPSLKLIWDSVFDDLGEKGIRYLDLSHWAYQGVLLLNASLTAKKNRPDSHLSLWQPFIQYLFDEILAIERGLPIIYFGKEAEKFEKSSTPFIHYNMILEHPAYSARMGREFKHKNVFSWVNKILKETGRGEINWILDQITYDELLKIHDETTSEQITI